MTIQFFDLRIKEKIHQLVKMRIVLIKRQCKRSNLENKKYFVPLFDQLFRNSITIFTLNPYPLSLSEESFGLVYDAVWPSHMGTITGVINCRLWDCMLILCLGGSFVFTLKSTCRHSFDYFKQQILTIVFLEAYLKHNWRHYCSEMTLPERIYNSNYGNGVPSMFTS